MTTGRINQVAFHVKLPNNAAEATLSAS